MADYGYDTGYGDYGYGDYGDYASGPINTGVSRFPPIGIYMMISIPMVIASIIMLYMLWPKKDGETWKGNWDTMSKVNIKDYGELNFVRIYFGFMIAVVLGMMGSPFLAIFGYMIGFAIGLAIAYAMGLFDQLIDLVKWIYKEKGVFGILAPSYIKDTFKQVFTWDYAKSLFKTILTLVLLTLIIITLVMMVFITLFWNFFSMLCGSNLIPTLLAVAPIIVEVAGIILTPLGIGIPIVGIGTILEVISMICDIISGDTMSIIMSLIGLIPLAGLGGNVGKALRKIT